MKKNKSIIQKVFFENILPYYLLLIALLLLLTQCKTVEQHVSDDDLYKRYKTQLLNQNEDFILFLISGVVEGEYKSPIYSIQKINQNSLIIRKYLDNKRMYKIISPNVFGIFNNLSSIIDSTQLFYNKSIYLGDPTHIPNRVYYEYTVRVKNKKLDFKYANPSRYDQAMPEKLISDFIKSYIFDIEYFNRYEWLEGDPPNE